MEPHYIFLISHPRHEQTASVVWLVMREVTGRAASVHVAHCPWLTTGPVTTANLISLIAVVTSATFVGAVLHIPRPRDEQTASATPPCCLVGNAGGIVVFYLVTGDVTVARSPLPVAHLPAAAT